MRHLLAHATTLLLLSTATAASFPDNSALYEAYSDLHALSQQTDALSLQQIAKPTVVVCGRQTDGKSALLEALMGFQFNHVGGGTKTRRPIAMQMQYHPDRAEPTCYLHTADGERQLSLPELQSHIERENERLEALGAFSAEEIVVRIEYRHCPNLSIVDTPGLLVQGVASPDAAATAEDAATADAANADDANASSPAAATAAGTSASEEEAAAHRTKLQAAGVEQLVREKIRPDETIVLCVEESNNWDVAPARALVAQVDNGLTRTVVVSTKLDTKFGQFGEPNELRTFLDAANLRQRHPRLLGGPYFTSVPAGRVGATDAHVYHGNDAFRDALASQEATDVQYVSALLGHAFSSQHNPNEGPHQRIGVSSLRRFLEELLRERYLSCLRRVVPQLQQASEQISKQICAADEALDALSGPQLQRAAREAVDKFVGSLQAAVQGSAGAACAALGQTLQQEEADAGGAGAFSTQCPRPANAGASLYGGAQFMRLLAHFRLAIESLPTAPATDEERTNLAGIAERAHAASGRASSAIALRRCVEGVRPLLERLHTRLEHVLTRLLEHARLAFETSEDGRALPLWEALEGGYKAHVRHCLRQCMAACDDDLGLPDQAASLTLLGCGTAAINKPHASSRSGSGSGASGEGVVRDGFTGALRGGDGEIDPQQELVDHTVREWKRHHERGITRKVHSHILRDLLISLKPVLSAHVEAALDGFDAAAARQRLLERRDKLRKEQTRTNHVMGRFRDVSRMYHTKGGA